MEALYLILISVCAFLTIGLVCVVIFRMREISSESKEISKRLKFWLSEKSASGQFSDYEKQKEDKDESFAKRVLLPIGEQVGSWMAEKVPYSKQSSTRKLLIRAGYRDKKAFQLYCAVQVFLAIAFLLSAIFLLSVSSGNVKPPLNILLILGSCVGGYVLPSIVVDKKAQGRQQNIDRVLPDALDLLVICTEAGMGIDQSLLRVASNLGSQGKSLAEEIIITNREMNLGLERGQCWVNLGTRGNSEELKNLARVIVQSEKVGSSIGSVLRGQAEFLRVRRRQKAEETAAKMTIKMMIPMAFFIFPCIMVVTMGPPVLKLVATFSGLGK